MIAARATARLGFEDTSHSNAQRHAAILPHSGGIGERASKEQAILHRDQAAFYPAFFE